MLKCRRCPSAIAPERCSIDGTKKKPLPGAPRRNAKEPLEGAFCACLEVASERDVITEAGDDDGDLGGPIGDPVGELGRSLMTGRHGA